MYVLSSGLTSLSGSVNTRGTKDLDELAELVIHSTHDLSNELSLY